MPLDFLKYTTVSQEPQSQEFSHFMSGDDQMRIVKDILIAALVLVDPGLLS